MKGEHLIESRLFQNFGVATAKAWTTLLASQQSPSPFLHSLLVINFSLLSLKG